MRPTRRLLALTASLLCAGITAAAALPSAAAADRTRPDRVPLPGTAPVWTAEQLDQGVVPGTSRVEARVYLAGRAGRALAAEAKAVSDPHSRSYRHFLTPEQIRARFAPSQAQIDAVTAWLTGAGFRVVGGNSHYLTVAGDASAATRAFGAHLHAYRKGGHVYTAPDGLTTVPASVADDVLSVTGLDSAPHQAHHDDTLPGPGSAFVNAPPMSDYYGAQSATTVPKAYGRVMPYVVRGYTGKQLRAAYGATATGLTGAGVKIAVVDAYDSPTLLSDLSQYATAHGDAPYVAGQLTRVDATTWTHTADPSMSAPDGCGASGWYGEQTLDLEAVHAMAPAANLTYIGAASCGDADLVDALNKVNDGHLADIVSDSWGEPELGSDPAMDPVYDKIFMTGAAEGIGYYFSSGDGGDEKAATGAKQTDMPASLPWVTAVGGTSLAVGADGQYLFETGWGTDKSLLNSSGTSWSSLPGAFVAGAGGGTSARVAQPSYQKGIVPGALSLVAGNAHRVVPDIAAVADSSTGFLMGQTQTFPDGTTKYSEYRIGGTSLASPVIAGIQALAQQEAGGPLGFANPAIYERYGTQALHDVTDSPYGKNVQLAEVRLDYSNSVDASGGTVTSLRTLGRDSSLHATQGYDDVTGVGTPSAGYIPSYGPLGGAPASAR
ncbi:S53 family peptidase [Streptacidiphilus jiangxiensis]|uniref:Subtilase family protein n=1 Tax=Streptacidiphilus jiangxiensis TaxID=235985 RepID=A0A1H7S7E2_STRJI|nr:S53 family peptidase [Streptacidiphilus jiangxiensis]SEL68571.1 Subtilase family protein [Streptacidiphilus jiangxiensis]